jgi:shikimate kinase
MNSKNTKKKILIPNVPGSDFERQGGLIFLMGFMGSGKTFWGMRWAKVCGLQFFDIDDMIEKEQGKSTEDIFAQDGEDHFRDLETAALRSFAGKQNIIIATGGGTPCYNDNITWMNAHGTTIYLQSSAANIFERLVTGKQKRPLVKHLKDEELLFYITEKIKERDFFYSQTKIILDVDGLQENYIPDLLTVYPK